MFHTFPFPLPGGEGRPVSWTLCPPRDPYRRVLAHCGWPCPPRCKSPAFMTAGRDGWRNVWPEVESSGSCSPQVSVFVQTFGDTIHDPSVVSESLSFLRIDSRQCPFSSPVVSFLSHTPVDGPMSSSSDCFVRVTDSSSGPEGLPVIHPPLSDSLLRCGQDWWGRSGTSGWEEGTVRVSNSVWLPLKWCRICDTGLKTLSRWKPGTSRRVSF